MKVDRPAREIVGGPNASEHAIDHGHDRRFGGDERSHLSKNREECGLAQVGRFTAHIRSGDHGDEFGVGVEIEIVRDESLRVFLGELFDHRMAARHDAHFS